MRDYLKKIVSYLKYSKKCRMDFGAIITGNNSFEGKNKVSKDAYLKNVSIGLYSYIGYKSIIADAKIGRFVSIGDNVVIVNSTHPLEPFVSTHPVFYSKNRDHSFVKENLFDERLRINECCSVKIGNDVWIGSHVLIKGGVRIGDGAVIAMGSVVVKDVDDYSIVGGVPARFIRNRFSDEERIRLIQMKWWNRPLEWIRDNASSFSSIELFLKNNKDE